MKLLQRDAVRSDGNRLLTKQARIPWLRVGLLNFVWFCEVYTALLLSVGLTFVARRLTADPRMITLVATVGLLLKGGIGPVINYVSDRIWTPWGRRRPFIIVAYLLSAAGLIAIPFMQSVPALLLAVSAQACLLAFASPMEPLYMELVPPAQQGRSQALRNALVQASVLYFFQVCLAQFNVRFGVTLGRSLLPGGLDGVHLAFGLGAALFGLMALYFAVCTGEQKPGDSPADYSASPPLGRLLRSFPRDVFADWRWWPVYGLYVAPSLISGVWGGLQSLMLVEQFGYDMTSMARIGLPVSLTGMIVIAPVLGYCADRGRHFPRWRLLGAGLLLLASSGWAWQAMPAHHLAGLALSLAFSLSIGLASVCLILLTVTTIAKRFGQVHVRAGFILVSLFGQTAVAFVAWSWAQAQQGHSPEMPAPVWLAYMALSQVFGLAATVTLMPLLFSKIPDSKFGTVSSGFGIFGTVVTYILGILGGQWVHFWGQRAASKGTDYTGLWLLQAFAGAAALLLVFLCLRAKSMARDHLGSGSGAV